MARTKQTARRAKSPPPLGEGKVRGLEWLFRTALESRWRRKESDEPEDVRILRLAKRKERFSEAATTLEKSKRTTPPENVHIVNQTQLPYVRASVCFQDGSSTSNFIGPGSSWTVSSTVVGESKPDQYLVLSRSPVGCHWLENGAQVDPMDSCSPHYIEEDFLSVASDDLIERVCPLADNATYSLEYVENEDERPLTEDEIEQCGVEYQAFIAHMGSRPDQAREIWCAMKTSLGRSIDDEWMKALFEDSNVYYRKWYNLYRAVRDFPVFSTRFTPRPQPPQSLDVSQLQLSDLSVGFYWRSCDRYPGGNADKVTGFVQTLGSHTGLFDTAFACDFDGQVGFSCLRGTSEHKRSLHQDLFQAALAHVASCAHREASWDEEVTFLDEAVFSSEDYETYWSSLEVIVRVHPDVYNGKRSSLRGRILSALEQWLPLDSGTKILHFLSHETPMKEWPVLLRIHQRALLPNLYSDPDDATQHRPAQGTTKQLLESALAYANIGLPETHTKVDEVMTTTSSAEFVAENNCSSKIRPPSPFSLPLYFL